MPWLRRPRSRLDAGQHRLHLALVWVIVLLVWAGGVSVASGTESLFGGLAMLGGAALATLAVLYLCRPVRR
jgi:hypothetical protein